MGQVKVRQTTIRKKNPSKPQKRIELRKATINNQVMKLNKDAANKRAKR